MSAEEKKKIDIKKLSTFLHNGLIIIGALSIILVVIMFFLDIKPMHRLLISVLIMVLGLLYTLINAPKK